MKLYQLLQSYEFEEIFPTVNVMFPNAQLHRDVFEKAFNMLCDIQPISSKKVIRFELMEDPNSSDMFVGANDSCFQTTWDVCLGKEIKKGKGATKTKTGIILTSSAQEKPQEAEVVAVGPGTDDVKMEVTVGQKVIYSKYAGTNVKMEEEEYIIVKQSDILAIVE